MEKKYSVCPLCEANCGIEVHVENGRIERITGDKKDPFSKGYICEKAQALIRLHEDPDRIRKPRIREGEHWKEVTWEEALAFTVEGMRKVQQKHGKEALAVFHGNPIGHMGEGVLYFEILCRLLQTPNIYSSASLDHLPQMVVAEQLFGSIGMFGIPDVDRTDFMVVMGANPLVSNGSLMTAPNIRERLRGVQDRGGKIVVIDPRKTETAAFADDYISIIPGTDVFFLLTFTKLLFEKNKVRLQHLEPFVYGVEEVKRIVYQYAPADVEAVTGVPAHVIEQLVDDFTDAGSAIFYLRVGVSVQEFGTLTHWLGVVIDVLTGNLDKEGGMMFTRPVIDFLKMADLFGAKGHYGQHRSRVAGYPSFRGELPTAAMLDEMTTPGKGQIKGLLTVAGNPVLSAPNGRGLEKALANLDFMVSVDFYQNETTRFANVILPPSFALESARYELVFPIMSVRNRARYSAAALPRENGGLSDTEILRQLCRRVHTGKTWFQVLTQLFPVNLLIKLTVRFGRYGPKLNPFSGKITARMIKNAVHGLEFGPLNPMLPQRLFTSDKKINLAPKLIVNDLYRLKEPDKKEPGEFTLVGRRDKRTVNSWFRNLPWREDKAPDCDLLMNPSDGDLIGVKSGDWVELSAEAGAVKVKVHITDDMRKGVVSLPHGWGSDRKGVRLAHARKNPGASVNDILSHREVDELTGTSRLNARTVRIRAVSH